MFCPVCSQEQTSADSRFCSRCGFLLIGVSQLIANGGALPPALQKTEPNGQSVRRRGIKQGAALTLSSFILVPVVTMFSIALHAQPFLTVLIAILTFWGGILRMLFALLFESNTAQAEDESLLPAFIRDQIRNQNISSGKRKKSRLPIETTENLNYMPPATNWRDTNDLIAPPSVTEETTKLLQKR